MHVRARYRPHPRGFGFASPVTDDGITTTTVTVTEEGGSPTTADRVFVPPPLANKLVADDLVDVEVAADEKGVSAAAVRLVDRPRRMLVGTVQQGPGRLVVEPDPAMGSGWVSLDQTVTQSLSTAVGRQIVVLLADADDGAPVGRALVAGPHVVASPAAVRARAVVVALGRAAPSLIPGGPAAAGLDPASTATTHMRVVGQLAGGGRGAAAGLDVTGPVAGEELPHEDRRHEPCVTIDDADTRDVDDAVAAHWDGEEGSAVEVAVHIADVGGVVGIGSPADIYARTVASTAYLAVGPNAPMLDPALAEDALSLLPGEDRWALSARFRVAADGTIEDFQVEPSIVRSRAKLTYAALEDWLDGDADGIADLAGDATDDTEQILAAAVEASRRLGVERDARITFEDLFDQAELTPAVVDGKLTAVEAEPHANAYRLIERLMVAANEGVAGWLVEQEIPALYRAHVGLAPDRAERLRAAVQAVGVEVPALDQEDAEGDVVMGQLLDAIQSLGDEGRDEDRDLLIAVATGSTARATYDPDPSHHRGLAAAAYTHFTSPIRRYADLVIHRQIRAALAGEQPPHKVEDLGGLAVWLDERAGALRYAQVRERNDLWARLLDRGWLSGAEPATVVGLTSAGLKIRLPRFGLGGFLTAERALGLNPKERASLEVDPQGLNTTSGPWRVGSRIKVRFVGLDQTSRPIFRLGDAPATG